MQKSYLSIPCHWDVGVLSQIKEQLANAPDFEIREVYGTPIKGHIPDGRTPYSTLRMNEDDAVRVSEQIRNLGFNINYLLNVPLPATKKEEALTQEYVNWILDEFKASSLTIASYPLLKSIRQMRPSVELKVSTIAGILTQDDMDRYIPLHPSRIVLHHDANRNFSDLGQIVSKAAKEGIGVEVMTTESCLRSCPWRTQHYADLGKGKSDVEFHHACNTQKIMQPFEFLKANLIRPEDLKLYESIGINNFKLTGRSKSANWLPEVTQAYLRRSYTGNLLRLTGIDPSLRAEEFIYIDNKTLDGFLEHYPMDKLSENAYCNNWIIKLWHENKFSVGDATFAIAQDGILKCTKLPTKLEAVYGTRK